MRTWSPFHWRHFHWLKALCIFNKLFQFTILYWPLSVRPVLSVCHISIKSFVMIMSYILPRAKLLPFTSFMKWSYLPPRENFKLPYLLNQAHYDPIIGTQLRSGHIPFIHQNLRDFMHGNIVYLVLLCRLSDHGRAREEGNCWPILSPQVGNCINLT